MSRGSSRRAKRRRARPETRRLPRRPSCAYIARQSTSAGAPLGRSLRSRRSPPNPRRPRSGSSSPNRPPAAPRRHPARGRELPRLRRRTYGDGQQDDNPRALCHVRHVPLLNARCTRGHGRCKFVRGGRCGASTGSSRGGTSAAVGARDRDDREGPPHGDGVDENFPPGCRRRRTILERVFWPRANEAAACVARRDARRVRPRGPV